MPEVTETPGGAVPWVDGALLRLVARFAIYSVVLFAAVTYLDVHTSAISDLRVLTASTTAAAANALGVSASQVGTYVRLPDRMLLISGDCTGLSVALGYCALVLAYPVRRRIRAVGLLAGVIAIVGVNLLRLLAVVHLSRVAPRLFAAAHDYLFQAGMALVALLAWTGWLLYARERTA